MADDAPPVPSLPPEIKKKEEERRQKTSNKETKQQPPKKTAQTDSHEQKKSQKTNPTQQTNQKKPEMSSESGQNKNENPQSNAPTEAVPVFENYLDPRKAIKPADPLRVRSAHWRFSRQSLMLRSNDIPLEEYLKLVERPENPLVSVEPAPEPIKPIFSTKAHARVSRNWNKEWQELLDLDDSEEKFSNLKELSGDFDRTCTIYASIIISELFLEPAAKTIPPLETRGVAGGLKYLWEGIFFKLAVDQMIGTTWIYGGEEKSDEKAMKSASHELNGAAWALSANIKGIHVPLMTLINYKGFRIVCIAEIPLDHSAKPIYGSNDAGTTVFNDVDLTFSKKIEEMANKLNLAPHQAKGKTIYGPTDWEGHLGTDGKYYLLDFARVVPPEADPDDFLIQLLRPELVLKSPAPLMSDSGTPFDDLDDPNSAKYEKDLKDITIKLKTVIIPQFASDLDNLFGSKNFKSSDVPQLIKQASFELTTLIDQLHKAGINLRFLGLVRVRAKTFYVKSLILTEMISRAVSNLLRSKWRDIMYETRYLSDTPFLKIALNLFNLVINDSYELLPQFDSTKKSTWYGDAHLGLIKSLVQTKFGVNSLTRDEKNNLHDLRDGLCIPVLFARLRAMTGVKFNPKTLAEYSSKYPTTGIKFFLDEIVELKPTQKHFKSAQAAHSKSLLMRADAQQNIHNKFRLLSVAQSVTEGKSNLLIERISQTIEDKKETYLNEQQSYLENPACRVFNEIGVTIGDFKLISPLPNSETKKIFDFHFSAFRALCLKVTPPSLV